MSFELKPYGRYVTLEEYNLDKQKEDEEDHLGISNFSFGEQASASQVGNKLYEIFKVIKTGKISDFGYKPSDIVLVENNMVEQVNIDGRDIYFILENYIVGVLKNED